MGWVKLLLPYRSVFAISGDLFYCFSDDEPLVKKKKMSAVKKKQKVEISESDEPMEDDAER